MIQIFKLNLIIWAVSTCCLCSNIATAQSENPTPTPNTKTMNSYISIFEIPATDITRAIDFYQGILGIDIQKLEFPEMQMGLLPYEDQMVTGVIMQAKGCEPSSTGVTVYLNGGEDLQAILDRVETYGGQILVPKTPHADEVGFFALFMDSEGNRLGLHSPN